jgi:type IX secretion system substrate protein
MIIRKTRLKTYGKACGICIAAVFAFQFANKSVYLPVISSSSFSEQEKKINVRIYPNPSPNGTVYISSNHNSDKEIQFYVFDLEGTMMHNIKLNAKVKTTITGLRKGIYMYDVFRDDESIERGKIIVK